MFECVTFILQMLGELSYFPSSLPCQSGKLHFLIFCLIFQSATFIDVLYLKSKMRGYCKQIKIFLQTVKKAPRNSGLFANIKIIPVLFFLPTFSSVQCPEIQTSR